MMGLKIRRNNHSPIHKSTTMMPTKTTSKTAAIALMTNPARSP